MKNTFSINIVFVLLIIVGISLVPFLSFQLMPSENTNALTISYEWDGALAEVIEKEVTSKIEGLASTLKGVQTITSKSSKGQGVIYLKLDENTNTKLVKFELNALIRSSHKTLPENVSLPIVTERGFRGSNTQKSPILYYTILGNGSGYYIQKFGEDFFQSQLSTLEGVESVALYGGTPYEWELLYNKNKLENNNITINDIQSAIRSYLVKKELGYGLSIDKKGVTNETYLTLKGYKKDTLEWHNIPVKKVNERIVYLGDITTASYKEQESRSYSRINGLNTTNMVVYAEPNVNQIKLVKSIQDKVKLLEQKLPKGFSLMLVRDNTEDLVKEIKTISIRIVLSIGLVLALVLIISRKWRYLFIIVASLIADLCIAFILYFLFHVEISVYALAGITVSFGILVDNSILMLDHLRYKKNKKVFLAILAATLTTIGALSVIFFLDDKLKIHLVDFAIVIVINLFASLLVAFFFIPALLDKFPLGRIELRLLFKRKRRVSKISRVYRTSILFGLRFKKAFVFLAILAFGIPVFWLPHSIEGDASYIGWYNNLFGSDTYETMRPYINKTLGGTMRLFTEVNFSQTNDEDKGRSCLYVRIYMPDGAVIAQTNTVAKKIENYLSQFNEIENYFTYIYDIENARIEILFKPDYDHSGFPEFLKDDLVAFSSNIGGCDMSISGVGVGFSNKTNDAMRSSILEITGYNYETILRYAEEAKENLLVNPRIQTVVINTGRKRYRDKVRNEYVMDLNNELLVKQNTSIHQTINNLSKLTFDDKNITSILYNNEYTPVKLKSSQSIEIDIWGVNNELTKSSKLKELGRLRKEPSKGAVEKFNQEFKVAIEYDFIGSYMLGESILTRTIDTLNSNLPMGFNAAEKNIRPWNPKTKSQYELVFLVILIIYFVCAIVLESLWQPLVVILMIPLSFIGVFLTFSIFELRFDQGGYASLLLLCGLVVNASLYIINDYNNLNKRKNKTQKIENYIKAYNTKISPISLTILSTILGLIPFLFSSHEEPFWFALSAGTIGGLIFSIPMLIVYLPIFMFWRMQSKKKDINLNSINESIQNTTLNPEIS
ncbi:efflux RND transporter permease subunit [Mariniflexile sp. HMF6888]|uniref:efflux RND transporter permease subunit n=1 Tax=Mariniflexile sp. HMF6888 TaxID=3373086 RepID=UPI00379B4E76